MKKVIASILIFGVLFLPVSFRIFADPGGDTTPIPYNDYYEGTSVYVSQLNSSYAGWNNNTPTHYGTLCSYSNAYPISLCSVSALMSTMTTSVCPTQVDIVISNPHMSSGAIVYCGMFNAYGVFHGDYAYFNTYFEWNDSIPGYMPKYNPNAQLGYINSINSLIATTSPSNFACVTHKIFTGTNGVSEIDNNTVIGTAMTPNMPVSSLAGGSVAVQPVYKSASNAYRLVRVIINAQTVSTGVTDAMSVRFRYDTNDLVKVNPGGEGGTTDHLHSAIFVPVAMVLPQYSTNIVSKIDTIVSFLSGMEQNLDSIALDINTCVSALYSGNESIIDCVSEIVEYIADINSKLEAVTGNRYESAVQYIEYYLENVASDTSTIVDQIDDILDTLDSISSTISAANTQAASISDTSEDIHDAEDEIFQQANTDIGNTVISSFAFDANTASGMGRVGIDFTNLWNALGNWHNVYIFSMTLTLAFTIIRYIPARSRNKESTQKKEK